MAIKHLLISDHSEQEMHQTDFYPCRLYYKFQNHNFTWFLYGCETWSLTLTEKHRLREYENGMLRRIFGPKKKKVVGGWKRLQNDKLHNLYASPNVVSVIKSKRIKWVGHAAHMGQMNTYKILVRKPEGKRPFRRHRYRWEDNIRTDLKQIV
jgi:hypothetical protein